MKYDPHQISFEIDDKLFQFRYNLDTLCQEITVTQSVSKYLEECSDELRKQILDRLTKEPK